MNTSKSLAIPMLLLVVLSLASCSFGEETLLIASFWIERTEAGYVISPTFDTLILGPELQAAARERIEAEQKDPTIYRVDVISSFGKRESHFTYVTYYPPDTDVGESLTDQEIPIGSDGYFDPLNIFVSGRTKRIEVYIADQLVRSFTNIDRELSINTFSVSESEAIVNDEIVQGFEVTWSIDVASADEVWVTIEYRASRNRWEALVLGSPEMEGSSFIIPDHIQSTLDHIDLRLSVTNGFSIQTQILEGAIEPITKELELELEGFYNEHRVGLNVNINLWFIDPETGVLCDGMGCTWGENQGKYKVTWFSDVQNICPSDIYGGTLVYKFKSEGTHRIGAIVQHTEKPDLNSEVYVDVLVGPGDLGFDDPNPDCSS